MTSCRATPSSQLQLLHIEDACNHNWSQIQFSGSAESSILLAIGSGIRTSGSWVRWNAQTLSPSDVGHDPTCALCQPRYSPIMLRHPVLVLISNQWWLIGGVFVRDLLPMLISISTENIAQKCPGALDHWSQVPELSGISTPFRDQRSVQIDTV